MIPSKAAEYLRWRHDCLQRRIRNPHIYGEYTAEVAFFRLHELRNFARFLDNLEPRPEPPGHVRSMDSISGRWS